MRVILLLAITAILICLLEKGQARRPRSASQRRSSDDADEDDSQGEENDIEWTKEQKKMKKTMGMTGEEVNEDSATSNRKRGRKVTDFLHPPTHFEPDGDEVPRSLTKLFSKDFSKMDFLESHHLYSGDSKLYPEAEVLMYVTPWNRKGKEHVTLMRNKVNWISPCWYQVRREEQNQDKIMVTGTQDEDWAWVDELFDCAGDEKPREDLKIVPRVVIETNIPEPKDLEQVVESLTSVMETANAGVAHRGWKRIHGFTLEIPLHSEEGLSLSILLPHSLKTANPDISIISVLPPVEIKPGNEEAYSMLGKVAAVVDRLSVMTYDKNRNGMPHSSLEWVKEVMGGLVLVPGLRSKLLVGMPLYGWRTGGEDMTAEKMVLWLASEEKVKVIFDKVAKEHYFVDSRGRRASYPSPYSLTQKLRLVEDLGIAGVAAWEAGQMPAAYMDVF